MQNFTRGGASFYSGFTGWKTDEQTKKHLSGCLRRVYAKFKQLRVDTLQVAVCNLQKSTFNKLSFLYFYTSKMDEKTLELKSVFELSPDEMQELYLEDGEELSLFEGDSDYMVIPWKTNDFWMDTVYFFIRSDKNLVIVSDYSDFDSELLEFCKGQDTRVSRSGYNSRSETWHWEYLEKNTREWWDECKNLKIAYRWGCGYVYTLFEYKN